MIQPSCSISSLCRLTVFPVPWVIASALRRVREAGFDRAEVPFEEFPLEETHFITDVIQRLPISIASIHGPKALFEKESSSVAERLNRCLETAAQWGAGLLILHPPRNLSQASALIVSRLLEGSLPKLEETEVALSFESMPWLRDFPDFILDLHGRLPYVTATIDLEHLWQSGQSLSVCLDRLGPLAVNIHIRDYGYTSARHKYLLPGKGIADFKEIARVLGRTGYEGLVTMETWFENDQQLTCCKMFLDEFASSARHE